ncbi:type VI secretion system baseplate subunit TssF [Azoarcus sp. KH32C]|uniref:type VI secretion system baseplate subunit TssF n=1 Tax=Azoarcus sp. KH32C TaxID=748247 RepID=UPI0002386271|nr:type VI secretion system baseplate subunit TssF [Azoarcus sp. KH32C]BAL24075.1 hypothetical protein AZKH_1762 [Azoarcus sp. KH32C]
MEELLPYYERELGFLRRHAREFAERYPKIAAQLLISGEGCDDPHVERMIESLALLNARVTKRLEDSYPQFTEALLNVLYPHYLRPFPSCSIAYFDTEGNAQALSAPVSIPRGTELHSRPVKGAVCRFRTAWSVDLVPVQVADATFEPVIRAPADLALPLGSCALLSLTLEMPRGEGTQANIGQFPLRFYIDAEPSVAAAVRDALFLKLAKPFVMGEDGRWVACPEDLIGEVGFADDEALIDMPASSHRAYRHLTEYFAFPEKYNFFDVALPRLCPSVRAATRITLLLVMKELRADSDASRLLQTLTAKNFRLGCVPVVNLFPQRGDPIRVTERVSSYPVVADGRRAFAYEVYSIDAVRRVRQSSAGETVVEFRPLFSLQHGEDVGRHGNYWYAQRNGLVAGRSPGYETEISLVDSDVDPIQQKADVLSIQLTCTNRELPTFMSVGLPSGDLFVEGGSVAKSIRLLRKPSQPYRFDLHGDGQWRLISHLSLNHLSLSGSGVAAFREMLALYDLPRSASSRRRIEGILAIEQAEKTVWMAGRPFATFVRGLEVRITVDEANFVGSGLDLFAQCIDRFLGLYAHLNSFVQLVLLSGRTGEELIRCVPRTGESILG